MDTSNEKKIEEIKSLFRKFKFKDEEIKEIGKKIIGTGGFGAVSQVIDKNDNKYAGKLIKREKIDRKDYTHLPKGPHIVNIMKKYDEKIDDEYYRLIIMEKALLKDLSTINHDLHLNKRLKLILSPPFEGNIGDNLLRLFACQIISGFETLDRNDYFHFDIKPENILIFKRMKLKISDFDFLSEPNDIKVNNNKNRLRIPGGTHGYLSPEYYQDKEVSLNIAKKQDYFALGSTLFELKYGEAMIPFEDYHNKLMNADYIIDLLQRSIDLLKSKRIITDKDFANFLLSLIEYDANERPNFEEIYRNKWINKNREYLKNIYLTNFEDEDKLLMEANKSDFLLTKKSEVKKNNSKFIFKRKKKKEK